MIQGTHWKCTWHSFGPATSKSDEDQSGNQLEPEPGEPMPTSTEEFHGFQMFQASLPLLANPSTNHDVAMHAHPTQSVSLTF